MVDMVLEKIGSRFIQFLVIVAFLSFLNGCAALKGSPDRYPSIETELQKLQSYDEEGEITKYNNETDPSKKKALRNEIVNVRIRAIDLYFDEFKQAIFGESAGLNIGTDVTLLALSGVGTVVPGAGVKSILAAISAGVTGTKASIDKNLFFEKAAPALVSQMIALRKEQLVKIRSGLNQEVDNYPLSQALIDVNDYFNAGTILGAVAGITEASGAKAEEADKELEKILTLQFGEDENTRILESFLYSRPEGELDENRLEQLRKCKDKDIAFGDLLHASEYKEQRRKAVECLNLAR